MNSVIAETGCHVLNPLGEKPIQQLSQTGPGYGAHSRHDKRHQNAKSIHKKSPDPACKNFFFSNQTENINAGCHYRNHQKSKSGICQLKQNQIEDFNQQHIQQRKFHLHNPAVKYHNKKQIGHHGTWIVESKGMADGNILSLKHKIFDDSISTQASGQHHCHGKHGQNCFYDIIQIYAS